MDTCMNYRNYITVYRKFGLTTFRFVVDDEELTGKVLSKFITDNGSTLEDFNKELASIVSEWERDNPQLAKLEYWDP